LLLVNLKSEPRRVKAEGDSIMEATDRDFLRGGDIKQMLPEIECRIIEALQPRVKGCGLREGFTSQRLREYLECSRVMPR
jgi:hypothetical protein